MDIDQAAQKILNKLRDKVEAGTDGVIYGDRSRALNDIDSLLASPSTEGVKYLLLPTANLQELSIENGWGQEFNDLADKLERLLGLDAENEK
ncbi:MAG: hypothetical protein V2B19_17925 [Pseudomonadota bacterium]